jgi:hypothetical protein
MSTTTDARRYLLRWKGRPSGPFTLEEIRARLDAGEISRVHQIESELGWGLLDDFLPRHAPRPAAAAGPESAPAAESRTSLSHLLPADARAPLPPPPDESLLRTMPLGPPPLPPPDTPPRMSGLMIAGLTVVGFLALMGLTVLALSLFHSKSLF